MGRVSAVQAYFLASMIGLISAQEPFDCAFTDHFCKPPESAAPSIVLQETGQAAQQACYNECFKMKDDSDNPCISFTAWEFGKRTYCYLSNTEDCDQNKDEDCFAIGKCISGPADCAAYTPKGCPALAPTTGVDNVANWVCHDEMGDIISGSSDPMPVGSVCQQSCPAWRSESGDPVVVESKCESNGAWSPPGNIDQSTVTYPPELKKPDETPLDCGCESLEIRWKYPDGDPYDPNGEDGADFICVDTLEPDADGLFSIDPKNYCKLFCDGHYVATVQCVDGEWTGNPEWGFWCYEEPPTSAPEF